MSSKTDWASGSGTRDALWLSYQARSYLTCQFQLQSEWLALGKAHLVIAEDLIENIRLGMDWVRTEAAYLVSLLYGRKFLGGAVYIIRVLVGVVNESELAK